MKADAPGAAKPKAGTRDRILDAAEIEFSIHGYEACSLRMISEAHDINLGLVHYYFGSKEALLSEVFLRRSKLLVGRRNALLNEARRRHGDAPVPVKEIARCFITPSADMIKEGEGPRAYIRLQGLLRSDPSMFSKKLRGKALNATNRKFIRELQRSCPHLSAASVVWRFSAMVGAFYSLISKSARVDELSNGLCDPDDLDAALAEAIPFIAGGFNAATTAGAGKQRRSPPPPARRRQKAAPAK
jgi:AcrR family transcriptional regulator